MKALFLLSLAAIPWLIAAAIYFACVGSIMWAIGSAEAIVLCLFIASREYDAIQSDREWRDATRHPRL